METKVASDDLRDALSVIFGLSELKLQLLSDYYCWKDYADREGIKIDWRTRILTKIMLNPGEFELWKMRIEQYFLMTDYALWEVIVNGDSYPPTTAEEKLARKNELKARGTLLMALHNEHQLKFNTYKCAKTLMEAIEKRFGGNKESKKTQKILLKQQYENFNGSSSEGLDQTYYRLQKLISQLEILGETISQEDMNLKFLRSLPSEWKTHTLIWRNKPNLDTLSMDGLYNNLKIYKTKVKGSSSINQNSQNVAFVSSNNSGSSNQAYGSNSVNTYSMSDAVPETIGFNNSKVECYNCHKKGHFARECRAPRENRNREPVRRNVIVETTETKSLVAQDGIGEAKTSVSKPKSVGEPLIEDWISDSEDENETEFKSKQRKPSFAKIEFVKSNKHVKTSRESVKKVENKKQAKYPRKSIQSPRGNGPNWLFDIDALTISKNYKPVVTWNQTNGNACTKENFDAGQDGKKIVPDQKYILLPSGGGKDGIEHPENEDRRCQIQRTPRVNQEQDANVNSTNNINTVSPTVNVADIENNVVDENIVYGCFDDPNMPNLEEIVYSDDDEEVGAKADINNLATTVPVSPIPTTRVYKDHPLEQIIRV
ncbi:ribonuclease H-like domain-containing protein [Tanacetum coccineum]